MKNKTLLILAGGLGSRFGGLKQMEPFGPNGEFIIDYSIFDAVRCGFNKIVFLIKEENLELFKNTIGKRIEKSLSKKNIEIVYCFQNNNNVPKEFIIPAERKKPLGTAHAVLCTKDVIKESFMIINSDDFYGYEAYKDASNFIDSNKKDIGLIGYKAINTMTENGSVKRGVCNLLDNKLISIEECSLEKKKDSIISTSLLNGNTKNIKEDTVVSMNMIIFNPSIMDFIQKEFVKFLSTANLITDEFFIPQVLSNVIKEEKNDIVVSMTNAKWVGVTYKEDKVFVVNYINKLIEEKIYPKNLWM